MTDDLFDYEQAIAERDAALRAVAANADVDWKEVARQVVLDLAQSGVPFIGDDVWTKLEALDVETHDNRALGAVMRKLATEGRIRKTGRYVPSKRRRMSPLVEWVGDGDIA